MEELLQLHIVFRDQIPDEDIDEWVDDLYYLLETEGFVVVNEDAPSFDDLGRSISTVLFERRADNMAQIAEIHTEIDSWNENSTVLRHEYDQPVGESRSPADPGTHIVLLATNWGVTQPTVSWKQQIGTLQAPPLVRDNRVYQAGNGNMYALDADSGTELWTSPNRTVQIPVGNDALIFGCHGESVGAVDAATGNTEWQTEFDELEDYMIDSRVAIGTDNVYVGLRDGDVLALSQADGSWSEFYSFTETPVQLTVVENGLVVNTSDTDIHLLNWNGDLEWTGEFSPFQSISDTHRGMLYGGTAEGVTAISAATGTIEWTTDLSNVRDVTVSQDTLLVTTKTSLHGLNIDTGAQTWEYTPPEIESVSDMVHHGDAIVCTGTRSVSLENQVRPYDEQLLHVFDPTTEESMLTYDLGIGDCYGLATHNDALICAFDGKLLCLDDFPYITN